MRSPFARRAVALGVAAAAYGVAQTALAEAIHLSYTSPSGCPTEAEVTDAIAQNGGRLARATEGQPARSFTLTVEDAGKVTGSLVVRDRDGQTSTRTIDGPRCADVVLSLAVLVSLALDPNDDAQPEPPPPATSPVPDLPPPTPPAPPPRPTDTVKPPDDAGPLPAGWRFGASGEGTLGQLGTDVALGLAAYVDLVHDVPGWSAFALRIGAEVAGSGATYSSASVYQGVVSLTRRVLRVEACPLRAVASQPWSTSTIEAWACGRFDAGVLQAGGYTSDSVAHPWNAPGPKVGIRWVDRHFLVDLEAGVMFPLQRETLVNENGTPVYRVPAALATGGFGVGWFLL